MTRSPITKKTGGLSGGLEMVRKRKKPLKSAAYSIFVAEGEGFEPSKPCDLHTFQACSFDHSDTPPQIVLANRSHSLSVRTAHIITS